MKCCLRLFACALLCTMLVSVYAVAAGEEEPVTYKWGDRISFKCRTGGETFTHSLTLLPAYINNSNPNGVHISISSKEPVTCTSGGWVYAHYLTSHTIGFSPQGGIRCAQGVSVYMEPLNHANTKFSKYADATCKENEKQSGVCKWCGETIYRDKENSVVDHLFESYSPYSEANCTAAAQEIAYCAYDCGETDIRTVEGSQILPEAHRWSNWTPVEDAKHERVCAINEEHRESEACETPEKCSKCGRTPPVLPATGDNSLLGLWAALMLCCGAVFVHRTIRKNA